MSTKLNLFTQGVSDDWLSADGDSRSKFRGALDEIQILSALRFVEALDRPDGHDGGPPQVTIESAAGQLNFTGTGTKLISQEADSIVSPENAAALASGDITLDELKTLNEFKSGDQVTAPPPPISAPPPPAAASTNQPKRRARRSKSGRQQDATNQAPTKPSKSQKAAGVLGAIAGAAMGGGMIGGTEAATTMATGAIAGAAAANEQDKPQHAVGRIRRRFTWRQYVSFLLSGGFILVGAVSIAGAISMSDRGVSSDDVMFALILAGMMFLIGFIWIYASVRQAPRTDAQGNRVDADGNIMLGVGMAHMMTMQDTYDNDTYDNDSYDGGDFGGD